MTTWVFYTVWVISATAVYSVYAYLSYRNNLNGGTWGVALWLYGLIPAAVWVLVSKYSKNILFDGMLFDSIVFLSFAAVLGFLSNAFFNFNAGQWVGFCLATSGFIMMKYYGM